MSLLCRFNFSLIPTRTRSTRNFSCVSIAAPPKVRRHTDTLPLQYMTEYKWGKCKGEKTMEWERLRLKLKFEMKTKTSEREKKYLDRGRKWKYLGWIDTKMSNLNLYPCMYLSRELILPTFSTSTIHSSLYRLKILWQSLYLFSIFFLKKHW